MQKLDKGFDYQNYRVSGGVLVAQNKRLDGLERKFFPENEGESKEEEGDVIFEVQEPADQSKSSENFENSKLSAFTNLKNSKNSASKSSNVSQKNSNNLQTTQQVNNKNNKNKNQNSKNSSSVFLEPEVPPEKPKLVRSTRLKNRPGYNKNNNNNNQSNKNDQSDKPNLANIQKKMIKEDPLLHLTIPQPSELMKNFQVNDKLKYSKLDEKLNDAFTNQKIQKLKMEQNLVENIKIKTENINMNKSFNESIGSSQNLFNVTLPTNGSSIVTGNLGGSLEKISSSPVKMEVMGGSSLSNDNNTNLPTSKNLTNTIDCLQTKGHINSNTKYELPLVPSNSIKISHKSRIFQMLRSANIDIVLLTDSIDLFAIRYKNATGEMLTLAGNANYELAIEGPGSSSRPSSRNGNGKNSKDSSSSSRLKEKDPTQETQEILKNHKKILKLRNQIETNWEPLNLTKSVVALKRGTDKKMQRWGNFPLNVPTKTKDKLYNNNSPYCNQLCRSVIQRIERENIDFTKKLFHLTWSAIEHRQEVIFKEQQELENEMSYGKRGTRTRKRGKR